jgi:pyroglutamyl-peptidase
MWIGLGVSRPAPPTLILETLARNRLTSERADVDGAVAKGSDVDPQGPPALPSRLPLTAIRRALRQAGHAHSLSDDAGGYVCNAVFYAGLRAMPEGRPGGFVHVPMCDAEGFQALRVATESLLDALVHHRTGERPDK